jgi:hypothetical protein
MTHVTGHFSGHVNDLAQHILSLEPDKDAARLCFYHFLKNLCEPSEPVSADLLNRFYCRALTFTHWQQNKAALFGEVSAILHHFSDTHRLNLPLAGILTPEQIQVVPAERSRTMELVINRHLERNASPFDQWRAFPEGEDRIIAITLQGDRSLRVTVYPKVLAIREGELVPLCQDFTLLYTPDLQLHPLLTHQLDVGPHAAARFRMGPEGVTGNIVRGYTFQKYSAMDGGVLHRYPVLFYPLKRLEQFFVNRKSDPMYIELTALLEKALELMNGSHPEAFKFATAALERGRLALEHIFPDDKLVRLLINNLEKTLALEETRMTPHERNLARAQLLHAQHGSASGRGTEATNLGSDAPEEADGIDLVEAISLHSKRGPGLAKDSKKAGASGAGPSADKGAERSELAWEKIRPLDL